VLGRRRKRRGALLVDVSGRRAADELSRCGNRLLAHLAAGAGLPAQPFRLTGRLRNSDPLTEAVDMKRIIRFFAGNGEYACKQQAKEKNNSSNWFFHDFLPMRQWFRRITADLFSRMQC